MQYYFAPMEGITGYPFRNTIQKYFPGADRYYSPFLVANQTFHFKKKELRDVAPDNNNTLTLIPQVMTAQAEQFVWAVKVLGELGYGEVNLNLGCPSATVVTRHKGAGMLEDADRLDRFFEEVFEGLEKKAGEPDKLPGISLKTRIGFSDVKEAVRLTEIFNRYPCCEIIIHPRLREEYYGGTVHREIFHEMYLELELPVVLNGDLYTIEDVERLKEDFPDLGAVMIGRGALRNPALFRILHCAEGGGDPQSAVLTKEELRPFLDELFGEYSREMSGDVQVMFKMKELWTYLKDLFPGSEKAMKKLRKAKTRADYEAFLNEMI
ncbi:MAG: tRNA-dihydrouridine synthase family protein [Eubacterium sp.]|nr:tRNA-dihydrouridine synthase family protein [Eubacterium sp.]